MILFHFKTKFCLTEKKKYKNWIQKIIESKGFNVGDINYIFSTDEDLLLLNKQYLNHDTYTDIITFNYNDANYISGDIFISIERVKENGELYGVTFQNELLRVMAHGILHLCGLDDREKGDIIKMRKEEEKAIALFNSLYNNIY